VTDSNRQETRVTTSNKVSLQNLSSYVTVPLGCSLFFRTEVLRTCTKAVFLKCALNLFTSVSRVLRVTI